ncbi:MAG: nicotinate (nicotinamide) nucleotide adenylyltransferase [Deltaproteobacteria bacterium]|nr:MAG: nicotinate (nicotinamide) nucleotide adenylyltransferase [Deltaproteobacteria bacterium]
MRAGLFGGTFNPIHLGHLRAAEEISEALDLERMVFIPANIPPHKEGHELAAPPVRERCVLAAISENPRFELSRVELERGGPSYSIDTIKRFIKEHPGDEFWFVVGEDAFSEIDSWYKYKELFSLVNIAVMSRPPGIRAHLLPRALEGEFLAEEWGYVHSSGKAVRFVSVTPLDISSTAIREAIREGRSIRYLVPETVREILEKEGHFGPGELND